MSDLKASVTSAADAEALSRLGSELQNAYVDEGEIGKGGVSSVRRAFEKSLQRHVAMKVLDPARARRQDVERFIGEARLTGRLEHPNIVPVHDVGVDAHGRAFFTMKLVQGRTLHDLLRDREFDPTDAPQLFRVLQVFLKACDALRFAHSRGIVHCDLKPMNIMVGAHGEVYVMDWGIARRLARAEGDGTAQFALPAATGSSGAIEGTAGYLSPEQADGRIEDIDERTDVFGLGTVLYRILCGRPPFNAADLPTQLAQASLCQIDPPPPSVGPRLSGIILRALEREKRARYPSVEALQRDLEAFLQGDTASVSRQVPAGTLVVREGETGNEAYVIEQGRCLVFRIVEGERRVIGELGPGDVFGETALFASTPRMASIEALTPLKLTAITRAALDQEIGRTYWVGRFARTLALRFKEQQDRLAKAEHERDDAQVEAETLRWFRDRAPAGASPRKVAWVPLRLHLCRKFGRTGPETLAIMKRLTSFELDHATDEVIERA